jgi:uncharacterized protein
MTQLSYAFTLFTSAFLKAFPFLLLGILVSSGLLVFVNEVRFASKFPRSRILGAIVGSALGLILPVGQYGNIPITRRLLLQGVPVSVAISFLIASPTLNPIVVLFTWKAFPRQPEMIFWRMAIAWVMAVFIGILFSFYQEKPTSEEEISSLRKRSSLLRSGTFFEPTSQGQPLHRVGGMVYEYSTTTVSKSWRVSGNLFLDNTIAELRQLGTALVLGCAIAAICQVFFSQAILLDWAKTPATQILVMLLLGVLISANAIVDVFFISLFSNTFLQGAILAFLLFGSIVNLKYISLMLAILRSRFVFYIFLLVGLITFLLTLILDFYIS